MDVFFYPFNLLCLVPVFHYDNTNWLDRFLSFTNLHPVLSFPNIHAQTSIKSDTKFACSFCRNHFFCNLFIISGDLHEYCFASYENSIWICDSKNYQIHCPNVLWESCWNGKSSPEILATLDPCFSGEPGTDSKKSLITEMYIPYIIQLQWNNHPWKKKTRKRYFCWTWQYVQCTYISHKAYEFIC